MDDQLLHIRRLFEKHIQDLATQEELAELAELVEGYSNEELAGLLEPMVAATARDPQFRAQDWELVLQSIFRQEAPIPVEAASRVRLLRLVRYAAAVVLILAGTAYFYFRWQGEKDPVAPATITAGNVEVAPGRNGAILTLADGRQLVLDSLANGTIAHQHGTALTLTDGLVSYDASKAQAVTYNTMSTPRGRQFRLTLPDGSKVWLNAASSITYPTAFTGKERLVKISGEAYLEVAKDVQHPFIIKLNENRAVEVLGTSLNIHAYTDEATIKTTLIDGSVGVVNYNNRQLLSPRQQAVMQQDQSARIVLVEKPDTDQVLAWKNGLFNFNGYDLRAVMREIGRWYDLDIVYEADPEPGEVMGEIERDLSLSQVMRLFEAMHVKYRIENKKLIIMR